MDMGVHYRLPGCLAVVEADVEPIGLELGAERGTHLGHEPPHRRLFLVGQLEQAGNVLLWDDERVALGQGESVKER